LKNPLSTIFNISYWQQAKQSLLPQTAISHRDLYLSQLGLKTLYPENYYILKILFQSIFFIETILLLGAILHQCITGISLLYKDGMQIFWMNFIGNENYTKILWCVYSIPVIIYIIHLLGVYGEKILFQPAIHRYVELPSVLKKIYKKPSIFALLTVNLSISTCLSLFYIVTPLMMGSHQSLEFYESLRQIFTGYTLSALIIYITLTKNRDCSAVLDRCNTSIFNPFLSILLWSALLFYLLLTILIDKNSFTLITSQAILIFILLTRRYCYRPPVFHVANQSIQIGLYSCSLLAGIFFCFKFSMEKYNNVSFEVISFLTILILTGFVSFFHYRKSSLLSFLKRQQVIREVKSLKEKFLLEAVNTGNALWTAATLSLGANPDLKDKTGDYLLHIAVKRDHSDVIIPLLKFGADINIPNRLKKRPLHIVASSMNYKILKLLIDAGADLNVKDMHGKTPLHRFCSHSKQSIKNLEEFYYWVKVLIHHGMDPLAKDKNGVSAFDLAKKWNLEEIVNFIEAQRQ
jgi:hypothetical protein